MANKNYIAELRKSNDPLMKELAEVMNERLIVANKTIFEFVPIDGLRWDQMHLYQKLIELIESRYFDGD